MPPRPHDPTRSSASATREATRSTGVRGEPASRPRTTDLAVASAVLVLASPFLAVGLLFLAHLAAYRGTCGPYAPDIPAHACGLPTYAVNFFSPFALPAIVLVGVAALVVTATTVALAWGVARIARALRR